MGAAGVDGVDGGGHVVCPARLAASPLNLAGRVDRYGGKLEGLLAIPATTLALILLFRLLPRVDPFRARYREFASAYALIGFGVVAFLTAIYAIRLMVAATAAGGPLLDAVPFLRDAKVNKASSIRQAPLAVVSRPWRRFVLGAKRNVDRRY